MLQAINAVGQGTATTVRYQPAVSTAIYAIDSQQRVVSISSSGTITPFSAGIPGATQVRPDHQGNVVVAGARLLYVALAGLGGLSLLLFRRRK